MKNHTPPSCTATPSRHSSTPRLGWLAGWLAICSLAAGVAAPAGCGSSSTVGPRGGGGSSAGGAGSPASGGAPGGQTGGSNGAGGQVSGGGGEAGGPVGGDPAGGGGSGAGATAGSGASGGRAGSGGGAITGTAGTGPTGGAGVLTTPWDWSGVVGTGQSLAVGDHGMPIRSTTQPYHNLKLSTGNLPWPVDPMNAALMMVPLIEPIGRMAPTYPSSWPTNISGETPHAAMGNQITTLVMAAAAGRDFISVQGNVGENGQCLTYLRKGAVQNGVNGHAYAATLVETQAILRLATAAGKTYGIGAITVTHGECDSGNPNYETDLYKLWSDYNTDLPAITGQTRKILMIVSQQNSQSERSQSTLAEWKIGVDHDADVVCSGPKYQYVYASDSIHLTTDGYQRLGEKYGQVYFERVVMNRPWRPLQPTTVERSGRVVTVHFHVPVPPLVWETTFQQPLADRPAWAAGKGFEVRAGNTMVTISSVAIAGDAVQITCATDLPATGVTVGYAMALSSTAMTTPFVGTFHWGLLRDSDPFVGSTTMKAQPNFAVAFELPVP